MPSGLGYTVYEWISQFYITDKEMLTQVWNYLSDHFSIKTLQNCILIELHNNFIFLFKSLLLESKISKGTTKSWLKEPNVNL